MGNKQYWLPAMGTSSRPRNNDDDVIAIRRRVRHTAHTIGGPSVHIPAMFDLQHLKWMDDGACIGTDPEAFFPDGTPENFARRICNSCPVIVECAEYAIPDHRIRGIWGGMTEKQRKNARERRARQARKDAS